MRIDWKHLAWLLAALPIVALVFSWIGFFNVGASSGHWKVTDWALHTAMRMAVKTYAALDVETPDELPMASIKPAAGHFARGCAVCHGAPGEPRSPAVLRMLPPPPDLWEKVGEWSDEDLFWIVKHGIRFTGMPAWPTQDRDDEVWAMVAFLRKYPDLDVGEYRELAYGNAIPASVPRGFEATLTECGRCHGADGKAGGPATPILAGQKPGYLMAALESYAKRGRHSGFMALPVGVVDAEEFQQLAEHFAAQSSDLGSLQRPEGESQAEALVAMGDATRGIPACIGCHGDGAATNPVFPRIAGQHEAYLSEQLILFRDGKRGGGDHAHLMASAAKHLNDADIRKLAKYLSTAKPSATP